MKNKNYRPRIGFHFPDEFPKDETPEKLSADEQLKELITSLYKPNGFTEEKDFKTSAEIAYELAEMIEVTTKQVADVMTELGFITTNIDNQVCFIVFIGKEEE